MPEFTDRKAVIKQNLSDAGCKKDFTELCLALYENKESEAFVNQLLIHRKVLLENLHQIHYQIDCLDYLLCQYEKGGKL